MNEQIEKMKIDVLESIAWKDLDDDVTALDIDSTTEHLRSKGYRKQSDVAREIFVRLYEHRKNDGVKTSVLENDLMCIAKEYGIDLEQLFAPRLSEPERPIKSNKLVRDKIPEIMADTGIKATFRVLARSEYMEYLEKKLDEEVAEFHASKEIEELADIMEVLYAIAVAKGKGTEHLDVQRHKKLDFRGGFAKRILLLDIEEGE